MGNVGKNVARKKTLIRGPLLPVAGAFVGGILSGLYLPLPVGFWFVVAGFGLLAAVGSLWRRHLRLLSMAALLMTVFAFGAVRMRHAYFSVPADDIVNFTGQRRNIATIRGRVASFPWIVRRQVEFGYQPEPCVQFVLRAEAVLTDTGWREASGLVRVTIDEPYKTHQPGDQLELLGWMGRYHSPRNPGQFDAAEMARRYGTMVYFTVPDEKGAILLSSASTSSWRDLPRRWRASLYQRLAEPGDLQSGQLLSALVLGDRHPSLNQLNRTMREAGLAHFLSISGMHLGIFLGFVYLLCRLLTISQRNSAIVVLIALGCYVILAVPRPALLRSAIMATALSVSVISGRRNSSLNALAAAGIILLVFDPVSLLAAGFQLSFAIVAGLILLNHPMKKLLFGRLLQRRGLMVFRDENRLRRWLRYTLANWCIGVVTICTTAYLVACPLVVQKFGFFSPYGVVLGIVLFPLIIAALVPGYLAMALAWPMPNLAGALWAMASNSAGLIARFVHMISFLPMLSVKLRPVNLWWVLLYYAALLAVLWCGSRRSWRKLILTGVLLVSLIGLTIWTQLPAGPTRQGQLHMLAVGAGQCAVLKTPAGKTYIIDAGTRSGFEVYPRILKPFLREMRLPDPTAAFVSHPNTDHYNALPGLTRDGKLKRVFLGDYFDKPNLGDYHTTLRLMKVFGEKDVQLDRLRAGDKLQLDKYTQVEVLWPMPGRGDLTANETSLVLRVTCGGQSVLLPGDLSKVGQLELLSDSASLAQLKSDVLVLPHHGGWQKTLPAFVAAVEPRIILVSSSKDPKGPMTASPKIRKFYESLRTTKKYRFYSTARDGWLCVSFGKDGLDVQTMRK